MVSAELRLWRSLLGLTAQQVVSQPRCYKQFSSTKRKNGRIRIRDAATQPGACPRYKWLQMREQQLTNDKFYVSASKCGACSATACLTRATVV